MFNLDVEACRTRVIHYLIEQGVPNSLLSMKESAFDMLRKTKKYLNTEKVDSHHFATLENVVFSIVEDFEFESSRKTEMFHGIPETLEALRKLGLKIALCTISGEKATSYILDRFDLKRFFDATFPRESVSAVKPNPIHLNAALKALKVESDETMLVGDSVKDITAATQLGVLSVGVTTGLSSKEELICSGANYIASSVTGLPRLIHKINSDRL